MFYLIWICFGLVGTLIGWKYTTLFDSIINSNVITLRSLSSVICFVAMGGIGFAVSIVIAQIENSDKVLFTLKDKDSK